MTKTYSKNFSLKKTGAILMAAAVLFTGFTMPTKVNAASKSTPSYRTVSSSELEANTRKIGGKYFSYKDDSYCYQSSKKKAAVPFSKELAGSQIATNGKYAYYQDGEGNIVKTKLSSKKTSTVIKDTDAEITNVYNSSIFYQISGDDNTTIYCYNSKKNKTKTITTTADELSISAAGRYFVFFDNDSGELKIRDCSKGKNKVISKMQTSNSMTDGKKVLYLAYNEAKNTYELTSYNIKKKTNTVLTSVESFESASVSFDLKIFAYESDGKYYKYDVSSKKTSEIKEAEYLRY